jgi:hypothetical protein
MVVDRLGEQDRLVIGRHSVEVRRGETPQQGRMPFAKVGEEPIVGRQQLERPGLRGLKLPQGGPIPLEGQLSWDHRGHEDDHEPGDQPEPTGIGAEQRTRHGRNIGRFPGTGGKPPIVSADERLDVESAHRPPPTGL